MSEKKYINRDLSWLSFNERVLQEAEDINNSLNERLKFLAIFSSNLDEFYRVRVSKLRQFRLLKKNTDIRKQIKPKKIIKSIQKRVDVLQDRFGKVYRDKLLKGLRDEGIQLIEASKFSNSQKHFSKQYFQKNIEHYINVYNLKSIENFDFITDKSLYFFTNEYETPRLINIPSESCERFIEFPEENSIKYIVYLDEIIRDNISSILPNHQETHLYSIKFTRDGELYYDEEDAVLIEALQDSLKERDAGMPTRVLYDAAIPEKDLKQLRKALQLKKTDLMPGARFHNFSDFFHFPEIESRIANPSRKQLTHHSLAGVSSIVDHIKQNDELLCFPYQNFDSIIDLLNEIADRQDVTEIYITLYRISKDSAIAKSLLLCLKHGKRVTVFVEAKARFDEENNIEWGKKLEASGAHVLYSMPDIKVHSKIMLVKTTDKNLAYIGTGNFNENSAKIYTDFAFLTSDTKTTNDLYEVFKYLLDTNYTPTLHKIWMSPFTTRSQLYNGIENEIKIAKSGKKASLLFKMNSLEDKGIIDKLYEAAEAGVNIKLIVRGFCCLNPEYNNLNTIKIISVVGTYLEHSRVYVFGNSGKNDVYIGSADCMERNLNRRVEVITPVEDVLLKETIFTCLDLQWHDNTKARIIDRKQRNEYQKEGKSKINAQLDFKTYLASKQLEEIKV